MSTIATAWSDYILNLMVELEIIRTTEVQELWKPTHGNCCTCQDCGRPHDECICEDNRIITTVRERLLQDWDNKRKEIKMSKIYIVQYYCFDYECEFSENIMAFTTKAEAKEYVSELEKNSKKARELLDNNRKTSEALLAPFRDKFRKKIATKEEIDEYQKIYSEQCTKEQKILTEMTEKYGYFSKNNDEEFIIDELTLHSPTN